MTRFHYILIGFALGFLAGYLFKDCNSEESDTKNDVENGRMA